MLLDLSSTDVFGPIFNQIQETHRLALCVYELPIKFPCSLHVSSTPSERFINHQQLEYKMSYADAAKSGPEQSAEEVCFSRDHCVGSFETLIRFTGVSDSCTPYPTIISRARRRIPPLAGGKSSITKPLSGGMFMPLT